MAIHRVALCFYKRHGLLITVWADQHITSQINVDVSVFSLHVSVRAVLLFSSLTVICPERKQIISQTSWNTQTAHYVWGNYLQFSDKCTFYFERKSLVIARQN